MAILTIVLLIGLLLAAIAVIAFLVWYEVYYKTSKAYNNVSVDTPDQGSLISGSS